MGIVASLGGKEKGKAKGSAKKFSPKPFEEKGGGLLHRPAVMATKKSKGKLPDPLRPEVERTLSPLQGGERDRIKHQSGSCAGESINNE